MEQRSASIVRLAHDPGDPQLLAHCPFCGSGQITGRSDGGVDCAFCGMSFLVRVQPSFAGMPQVPGMGAPTDVGPEMMGGMPPGPPGMGGPMGELPPGAPGDEMPPGMPGDEMAEGLPPGAEEPGEGEDGEGGFPPQEQGEDGEGGEDSSDSGHDGDKPASVEKGKGKDKKGKGKKEGSRRYRTLAGDILSEEQYVRHLAVLHSGASPTVLAQIRRESGRRLGFKQASQDEPDPYERPDSYTRPGWAMDWGTLKRRNRDVGEQLQQARLTADDEWRFGRTEGGHVYDWQLSPQDGRWALHIDHPGDPTGHHISADLGDDDSLISERTQREFRHPETMKAMRGQWQRAIANGDPTGREEDKRLQPRKYLSRSEYQNFRHFGSRKTATRGYSEADDDGFEWPLQYDPETGEEEVDETSAPHCTTCDRAGHDSTYHYHWPEDGHNPKVQARMDREKALEDRWDRGEYDPKRFCGPACEEGHHQDVKSGLATGHAFYEGETEWADRDSPYQWIRDEEKRRHPQGGQPMPGVNSPYEEPPGRSSGRYEARDPSAENRCHYCRRILPSYRRYRPEEFGRRTHTTMSSLRRRAERYSWETPFEGSDNRDPDHALTHREHITALRAMRDRMREEGFPVEGPEDFKDMWPHPHFNLETGHRVGVTLDRVGGDWGMVVHHENDHGPESTMMHVRFGTDAGRVPRLIRRELGCPVVGAEMMRQMRRGHDASPDAARLPMRWIEHDAEGLQREGARGWQAEWPDERFREMGRRMTEAGIPEDLESGHHLKLFPDWKKSGWALHIEHPGHPDDEPDRWSRRISIGLGRDDESIPERVTGALRRPDVMEAMRAQMEPNPQGREWHRRFEASLRRRAAFDWENASYEDAIREHTRRIGDMDRAMVRRGLLPPGEPEVLRTMDTGHKVSFEYHPEEGDDRFSVNVSHPGDPQRDPGGDHYHWAPLNGSEENIARQLHDFWRSPETLRAMRNQMERASRHQASKTAADQFDRLLPGDNMSIRDQHARLRQMRETFRENGYPVEDTDERGYEHLGPLFRLDTGHRVSVGISRADFGWVSHIHHPDDNRPQREAIVINLGTRDADVPRLMRRELACRHVAPVMIGQMRGKDDPGPNDKGIHFITHDAEGAALPESPEDS